MGGCDQLKEENHLSTSWCLLNRWCSHFYTEHSCFLPFIDSLSMVLYVCLCDTVFIINQWETGVSLCNTFKLHTFLFSYQSLHRWNFVSNASKTFALSRTEDGVLVQIKRTSSFVLILLIRDTTWDDRVTFTKVVSVSFQHFFPLFLLLTLSGYNQWNETLSFMHIHSNKWEKPVLYEGFWTTRKQDTILLNAVCRGQGILKCFCFSQ